jgi:hypothetical protein
VSVAFAQPSAQHFLPDYLDRLTNSIQAVSSYYSSYYSQEVLSCPLLCPQEALYYPQEALYYPQEALSLPYPF